MLFSLYTAMHVVFSLLLMPITSTADDYIVASNHKSLVVAMGCFWCGEESFERYAPGVIEAVSGYSGGSLANPTYYNHNGHFESVLVEYDPNKTSYEILLSYTWRNIDPFDGTGQFCDRGNAYRPAIFYADEEERLVAESTLADVEDLNLTSWQGNGLMVPILERKPFWTAEDYHQEYYQKNPGDYNYYKKACGRSERLKEVWGEEAYSCYHNVTTSCVNNTAVDTIENSNGTTVKVEANVKNVSEGKAAVLPSKYVFGITALIAFVCLFSCCILIKKKFLKSKF